MSYKLLKPYTETQRIEFIVERNHKQGLRIEETEEALFALENNEVMEDNNPIVDEDYEAKLAEREQNRIKLLSMTKLDFFKYVLSPAGISYADLQEALDLNENFKVAWDLCSRVYRGDKNLNLWAESAGIDSEALDESFKEYGE